MKQSFWITSLLPVALILLVFFIFPQAVHAGTKTVGTECGVNSECTTNQCENADNGKAYCVACDELDLEPFIDSPSAMCATAYGAELNDTRPTNWLCKDGGDLSWDLNYCLHLPTSQTRYAIPPKTPSGADLLLDTTAASQQLGDELKQMIAKPQTRIAIPGLSFTDVDKLTQTTDETGATYMYFPFLGEYLAAIYKYAIAVMGIIAVIMIIVGGVVWITSGGIPERVNQAKTIIVRSVVGMILAVGSYTLLYTINPELVQFRNLKVLTIQGVPLTDIADIDFRTGGSASTNEFSDTILTSNTVGGPDIATDAARCEASPSQPSGIGDTKYLGQLDCNSSRTRKSLLDIKNIILHDGGRTAKGTVDYWKSNCQKTGKCVNTHYFIERDGTTYQLLDEKKVAIHTPSWNSASIGIDLATVGPADRSTASCLQCKYNGKCKSYSGKPRSDEKTSKEQALLDCSKGFTEAQYTSLKKIIDSIVARTGVTKDGESIRAHCNASGNHSDPVGFDWSKIGISPKQSQSCSFDPEYSQKLQADADKIFSS